MYFLGKKSTKYDYAWRNLNVIYILLDEVLLWCDGRSSTSLLAESCRLYGRQALGENGCFG